MGVYIPNMDKPKSCYDCKVEKEADCHIWRGIDSASNYTDRIYGLCPLIEIVYCKDCIHSRMGEYSGELECTYAFRQMCDDDNCYTWLEVSPDDFCSYAERRE